MAVVVMFPEDRLQQPATPVQKANEDEYKGRNEETNHGSSHVNFGHLIGIELLGFLVLIRNGVVNVHTVGFHW
jgi:hypothetical protein